VLIGLSRRILRHPLSASSTKTDQQVVFGVATKQLQQQQQGNKKATTT